MTGGREVDCLIVGGGPGGLTAATYLGRFRRSVVVVDAGQSRLQTIPLSRNVPGFPDGVGGRELHARLRAQAIQYGAELLHGDVSSCEMSKSVFVATTSVGSFRARTVLLATGVDVTEPQMARHEEAVARGLIRYCPICDGFEARDASIAVLGARPGSIDEALFLLTYSRDVTFVRMEGGTNLTEDQFEGAKRAGVALEEASCLGVALRDNAIELQLASGERRRFDIVYPCLGSQPRTQLAKSLGAKLSGEGELLTDSHQATNVAGLYAVGDVLRGLDQVASACGQAAIAATAIHNRLREFDHG